MAKTSEYQLEHMRTERQREKEFLESTKRKCHDCHKLTWNYRSPECDAKHKRKHGVFESISDAED